MIAPDLLEGTSSRSATGRAGAGGALRVAAAAACIALAGCQAGGLVGMGDERPAVVAAYAYAAAAPLAGAKDAFRHDELDRAETLYRDAVRLDPDSAEGWIGLAAVHDRKGDFASADAAYAEAVRIAGRCPEVLNNLGYSYYLRGESERARATFAEATALDPDHEVLLKNLALVGG